MESDPGTLGRVQRRKEVKVGLICLLRGDELDIRIWTMDGYDDESVSASGAVFFFVFVSMSDTLAFADQESDLKRQSRDEDEIKIEAGTRCVKYFKDGYRCVSSRTAPHHTAPPQGRTHLM